MKENLLRIGAATPMPLGVEANSKEKDDKQESRGQIMNLKSGFRGLSRNQRMVRQHATLAR